MISNRPFRWSVLAGACLASLPLWSSCLSDDPNETELPEGAQEALTTNVSLAPSRDVSASGVTGVPNNTNRFSDVDDAVTFAGSDGDSSYVVGRSGFTTSTHRTGYAGGPAGTVSQVVVSVRARRSASNGTMQVKLYDGATLVGTGPTRTLTSSWSNFTSTFSGLSVASVNNLATEVVLRTSSGSTSGVRYTMVFITATVVSGCGTPAQPVTVTASKRVIPLYLAGSDTAPADAQARNQDYTRAMAAIQVWYGQAMGVPFSSSTFRFETPRILTSRYTRAQWADFGANGFLFSDGTRSNGCGLWYAAADELGNTGLLAAAGLPPLSAPGVFYQVIGGGGSGGGCGAGGLSAVEELTLDRVRARCPNGVYDGCTKNCTDPGGLGGIDPWCNEWPHNQPGYSCTFVGALAHEIGHGFGLPHGDARPEPDRSTCFQQTIMDAWWEYGRGITLCDPDRRDLSASGYFAAP